MLPQLEAMFKKTFFSFLQDFWLSRGWFLGLNI